jgi:hypothetical protein
MASNGMVDINGKSYNLARVFDLARTYDLARVYDLARAYDLGFKAQNAARDLQERLAEELGKLSADAPEGSRGGLDQHKDCRALLGELDALVSGIYSDIEDTVFQLQKAQKKIKRSSALMHEASDPEGRRQLTVPRQSVLPGRLPTQVAAKQDTDTLARMERELSAVSTMVSKLLEKSTPGQAAKRRS